MESYEDLGVPLTHQKITPGNTITALGAEFYKYKERKLAYTSGGTTEIVVGDWIVGATSSAKAEVVGVLLASGTWAGGNAVGTLYIRSQHGTFQSENIKVAAGTDDATIAANSKPSMYGDYVFPQYYNKEADSILVNVQTQAVLVGITGGKPDQTALVGQKMEAGQSWALKSKESILDFKCVDYTAGSASTLQITYFFR